MNGHPFVHISAPQRPGESLTAPPGVHLVVAVRCTTRPAGASHPSRAQPVPRLGPVLARTWRTIERLVGSAWPTGCRATSSACTPRWRHSAPASSHGCPSGRARSTTGCSAHTSTGSPSSTPTGPSTPTSPSKPPASTTFSTAAPPSPAASASNHDPPPGPPTPPGPGPPRVPHGRPRPPDPARTPLQVPLRGTCPPSPERDPVSSPPRRSVVPAAL
jgi:hypothetical protein